MQSDARYVSKEDLDAALAKAKMAWKTADKRETAERVDVDPVNEWKVPPLAGNKSPESPEYKTEPAPEIQEVPRSKPSRSIAYVIGGLLVLGSSSFAYFQHKESEAKLARAQQTLEEARLIALSAAPSPAVVKFNDPVTPDRLKQIQQKKYVAPYFYAVLDELIVAFPELIDIIFETKLIDSKTKQYWFDILPSMSDQQMSNLFEMLKANKAPEMPTPPSEDVLQRIFNREMIGATLSYLEKITGPAKYSSSYKKNEINNTYEISGCSVDVRVFNGSIMSLGLNQLSQKCTFNLNKFFPNSDFEKLPRIHNMTFGQFDSLIGDGKYTASCLISCGNAVDPVVYEDWEASRAEGGLELQLGVTLASDSAINASIKWEDAMVKGEGEDWVIKQKFACTNKYNSIAKNEFKNVRVTSAVIGLRLSANDCNR